MFRLLAWTMAWALLAAPVPHRVEVRVSPACGAVAAGSTRRFSATLERGARPDPEAWRWTLRAGPGTIDEHTGCYRA